MGFPFWMVGVDGLPGRVREMRGGCVGLGWWGEAECWEVRVWWTGGGGAVIWCGWGCWVWKVMGAGGLGDGVLGG